MSTCRFVPPYLLDRLAQQHPDPAVSDCSRATLQLDQELRSRRSAGGAAAAFDGPFGVHSADNGTSLPGRLVRAAGAEPVGDPAVDEAYVGVEASLALFADAFGRSSYDGEGAPVVATVHYGRDYDNAFWDGSQLVFGDGDGEVFGRFTEPVDVLAHEFTHGVTQFTAGLEYAGQSGALNESISDVFASCVKQRLLGQSADQADWLIGEGLFLPSVNGRALRSMAEPGTAYDDPVIGKDPQVGSMADYVVTQDDNGGVHLNSGIPNRAFHLTAVAIGGESWGAPGQVWYSALTSGLGATADFAEFAAATVAAAGAVSPEARDAVEAAWTEVGVLGGGSGPASDAASGARGRVAVRRSGGFAGLRQSAEATLGEDPRTADLERLLGRIDLRSAAAHASKPQPDRYVYTFDVDGEEVTVGEQDLTPELQDLAHLLLTPPTPPLSSHS